MIVDIYSHIRLRLDACPDLPNCTYSSVSTRKITTIFPFLDDEVLANLLQVPKFRAHWIVDVDSTTAPTLGNTINMDIYDHPNPLAVS
jgi:hypothetical protein